MGEPIPAQRMADVALAAGRGDREALAQLYRRYYDMVLRYVYFRVGNRQVAEDLAAEVFVRVLRRINGWRYQDRDPGAWVVTIAKHLVADYYKCGYGRFESATGDVLDVDEADQYPGPETEVLDHIRNVDLLRALKLLTPEQQEVLILRFLRDLSVAETARAMGRNEGAVKALQYRAVRSLARVMDQPLPPPKPRNQRVPEQPRRNQARMR